ncbi:MAG: arginine deiminase-related protein [Pyrinomonadaceae bacterium]
MLIRPLRFGYNRETAETNKFQAQETGVDEDVFSEAALIEFDRFAETLRSSGVNVFVFDDTAEPEKPDAIFPNNWVSFHADATVVVYPMCAANRRPERRPDIIDELRTRFRIDKVIDLSHYETRGRFLEGTGSIVFDHVNRVAYACLSPRTDAGLLAEVCGSLGYRPHSFHASDANGDAIYHTNVMMCVGTGFVVICLASITSADERKSVVKSFEDGNLAIIDITLDQMNCFAGNMLEVAGDGDKNLLVLSATASESLNAAEKDALAEFCTLLPIPIPTIETVCGGSSRCMIAEIFLPNLA